MASSSRMSLLTSRLSMAAAARPGTSFVTRRAFTNTPLVALKESNSHQPDPEANERHKQDSLAKQKQGKGHWKPELASDSEESVKADRAAAAGHDGGGGGGLSEAEVKKLQGRTKQAAEEKTKHGTSARDGL